MAKNKNYFSRKKDALVEGAKKTIGTKEIHKNFDYLKENMEYLMKGIEKNKKVKNPLTFEESVRENEVTEEDLERNYKTNAYIFYVMLVMFFVIFGLMIFYFFSGNAFVGLVTLIVSGVPLSKMFQSSVNCFRIKHRKFATVQEWSQSGEFVPTLNMKD